MTDRRKGGNVIVATVVGRSNEGFEPVVYKEPRRRLLCIARAGPVKGQPELEEQGAKSWVKTPDDFHLLYITANFETLVSELGAVEL